MKRRIKLTESEFNRFISHAVRNVLNELAQTDTSILQPVSGQQGMSSNFTTNTQANKSNSGLEAQNTKSLKGKTTNGNEYTVSQTTTNGSNHQHDDTTTSVARNKRQLYRI